MDAVLSTPSRTGQAMCGPTRIVGRVYPGLLVPRTTIPFSLFPHLTVTRILLLTSYFLLSLGVVEVHAADVRMADCRERCA